MKRFGLMALFPGKNLSKSCKRQISISFENLLESAPPRMAGKRAEAIFWLRQNSLSDDVHGSTSSDKSTDSTYIKLPSEHVYLMAIMDWYSRKVLSWRVFNTMDAGQCARLLRETIEQYGCPAIFNTDQGAQFTSDAFTAVLIEYSIEISMDGRARALDNIRIERLWRSLKYEDIYLKCYETMGELKAGVAAYCEYYNSLRLHQGLDYEVPDDRYQSFRSKKRDWNRAA